MIAQYQLQCSLENGKLFPSTAYKLYAWLLEQLPSFIGEQLHSEQYNPFSQYLYFNRENKQNKWVLNVLDDSILEYVEVLFERNTCAVINEEKISLELTEKKTISSATELVERARTTDELTTYSKFLFPVPTSFRVAGRYSIFPSEKLILQSMINRWNSCFTNYVLDDEDAFSMLEQNLHIVDYDLRSTRFLLKGNKIPGFTGDLTIQAKLPAPMMEIWKLLLLFVPFSGIGIKTTLGMGGVQILTE